MTSVLDDLASDHPEWLADVPFLVSALILYLIGLAAGSLVVAVVLLVVDRARFLVRRHRDRRTAAARARQVVVAQVNDSVSRLQAAYWQTQRQLREEASQHPLD